MFQSLVSVDRTVTFHYDHPTEKVLALLLDPEFVTERSRAMGDSNIQVSVRRDGPRVVVVNQRDVQRDLPSFARKLFSPVNRVTETDTWDTAGEVATGTSQVDVRGVPATIRATFELRPQAAGSEYRITYDIAVRVPLIGGKLESYTLEQTKLSLRKELEYTADRLRRAG